MNKIDVVKENEDIYSGYISLEEDMFTPKGFYIGDTNSISIVFDSGFSMAVSPCKDDSGDTLVSITKIMQGLGAPDQVHGEGRVNWMFKDDYGVT